MSPGKITLSVTRGGNRLLNAFASKATFLFSCLVFSSASYEKANRKLAFCLVSIEGKILSVNKGDSIFQFRESLVTGRNYPGTSERKLDIPTYES